jgi:hypothetical protein
MDSDDYLDFLCSEKLLSIFNFIFNHIYFYLIEEPFICSSEPSLHTENFFFKWPVDVARPTGGETSRQKTCFTARFLKKVPF